jgi:cystathionine gamma-synthase
MVVLRLDDTPFGHCVPPESNYAITTNVRGWATAMKIRDGDKETFQRIVHLYPRFKPMRSVKELASAVSEKLGTPATHSAFIFTCPSSFEMVQKHACDEQRLAHRLVPEDLIYKCIDIDGVRLYLVYYPTAKTPGVAAAWQEPGIGVSLRLSESLIPHVGSLKELPCTGDGDIICAPLTPYLAEGVSHGQLRRVIADLVHRAPIDPEKVKVTPEDVYLFGTGMAAIRQTNQLMLAYKPATVVVIGIIFHNTIHYLEAHASHGLKHFGNADDKTLDEFEVWLEAEHHAGRGVSYLFVEFPSNPLLISVDLRRLKELVRDFLRPANRLINPFLQAEKYNFPVVVDDTIGSFCNIDLVTVADVLVTSLTKSFSGYADVMAGSVILNPLSIHYNALTKLSVNTHHNELYIADADALLKNCADYLPRSRLLNRNAAAMASHLHVHALDPASPVARVHYPSLRPDVVNYKALMCRPTEDFPEPGYGCLLSLDFEDLDTTIAFYDTLKFYAAPHLGAHRTLTMCFNALAYGKKKEEAAYYRTLGLLEEAVRISAGLEDVQDLIDTLDEALAVATEVKRKKSQALSAK